MTTDKIEAEGFWLTAKLPTLLAAYIRIRNDQPPISPNPSLSQAANFLAMLHGTPPDTVAVHALDTYMVILAENGLNISTFVASVVASTRNDLLSAITAAIATLKGQAHGGANELALRTFQAIGSPDNAKSYLDEMLARKERLMGVGHRVFDVEDPRKRHMYEQSRALAQRPNTNPTLHLIAERVAEIISTHPYYQQRQLYPNVEFYSAPLLAQLGFPADCLTAVFACARMPGWIAHIREQLTNRQLVRPEAVYRGERGRTLT
jgi:citrate synthase